MRQLLPILTLWTALYSATGTGTATAGYAAIDRSYSKHPITSTRQPAPARQLFTPIDAYGPPEQTRPMAAHILRRSFVTLDLQKVRSSARSLTLNLFPNVTISAARNRTDTRSSGDYLWFGKVSGDEYSSVVLTVAHEKLVGTVLYHGRQYRIQPLPSGNYEIREINPGRFPVGDYENSHSIGFGVEHNELPYKRNGMRTRRFTATKATPGEHLKLEPLPDDGSVIDVLALVTPGAISTMSDDYFIAAAEIRHAIDNANISFWDSGINTSLNLVFFPLPVQYLESSNKTVDRDILIDKGDNHLDQIHTLRDDLAADIVVMFTRDDGDDTRCGLSWTRQNKNSEKWWADHAFAVTEIQCAATYTFAHEIGHLLGAHHDWYVANEPSPAGFASKTLYPYAHGYTTPVIYGGPAGPMRYRTIMAYRKDCQETNGYGKDRCPTVAMWSNPDLIYKGVAAGRAEGTYQAADNRKVINQNAYAVANYRLSACRNLSSC